jgi:hypothetical protein
VILNFSVTTLLHGVSYLVRRIHALTPERKTLYYKQMKHNMNFSQKAGDSVQQLNNSTEHLYYQPADQVFPEIRQNEDIAI